MSRHYLALEGVRILSLALNVPGPAALMRCRAMGARCTKLDPPLGDPLRSYNPAAYDEAHQGVRVLQVDLKTAAGQELLHRELADTDILLTSFRPSAIAKLGLGWEVLSARYPLLSHVAIVGAEGPEAEEPGHDLTYLAAHNLVGGLELPPTLYADMSGSLLAVEAVLQAALRRRSGGVGLLLEVALASGAAWLAMPRRWGLTQASGVVGGAHAGYGIYPCLDGRVALAALEPHFAKALCAVAGVADSSLQRMLAPETRNAIARFIAGKTRAELERLRDERDIPLHTLSCRPTA